MTSMYHDPVLDADYVPGRVETASFGMGCFWGPDGLFGVVPGVIRTRVGYSGGTLEHPSYHDIGDHIETIQIDYDPSLIAYEQLLDIFWTNHNPYSRPYANQYRSMVFAHDETQQRLASESLERVAVEDGRRPLTEVVAFAGFTRAENYHQKYRLQTANKTRAVHEELLTRFETFDEFVDSTIVARINGYASGAAGRDTLEQAIAAFDLSADVEAVLLAAVPAVGPRLTSECSL